VLAEQFSDEGGWKMEIELPAKTLDYLKLRERIIESCVNI